MKIQHISIRTGDTSNRCVLYHIEVYMDLRKEESLKFTTWVSPKINSKIPFSTKHVAECILNKFRRIVRQLNQPQATLEMMACVNANEHTVNAVTGTIDLDHIIHELTR